MTEPKSLIERLRDAAREGDEGIAAASDYDLMREAATELADYERPFVLFNDASMRAIKAWQTAHPDNDMVWPDQAKMVEWLMDEHVKMQEYEVRTRARRFRMYDALKKCADQFRFYEKNHRFKGDGADTQAKADTNMRMAAMCEAAIKEPV